ncbi:peroxiredoxin [Leucobacter sp. OLJS4]|uniref:peroxiredoxin n=1 Tax=unclassified Leucobacter TaxID=2621730 RepID=UPI000C1887DB|nr:MULTISPECIES: peroxiredoxin [unclassified Leucobacter]PIJ55278.1 peroxiredoxin [Leucobacter sp. OLES1]PII81576.1 peroxiredoxin [Leucobacter sp. OLCALW19]PII86248.1 peroxiredoxin [Leucobacter sp. OLTLW20]PII90143.1 peroxiredoxin [Leucobacter sp. OLAS13]PII97176.1 peroxiredoxin [Leucobacter sp. OLDS2]
MVLEVGAIAPDFTLSDQHGEELNLTELVAEGPVALVFFPLAFSGICTGELCALRDNLSIFDDSRVRLVGISVDSVYALKAWAEQEKYEFSILSDFWPHGAVAQQFGAFVEEAGIATRATIVIGEGRKVLASFETSPGEARDFGAYREAIEGLAA